MKRTAIRRRPHIDPDRIQSREAYRSANYFCEITLQLGLVINDGKLATAWEGIVVGASDLNHIWRRDSDCRSNFIMLSQPMHRAFHGDLPLGRILAIAAKIRKAARMKDPTEFVLADLDEAAGKRVLGAIESYTFTDPLFSRLRDEVLEGLARLEREEAA